ncbi:MAG: hypothetical protein J7605_12370 [Variovorax sp.]|nr:hypothetical protein [Variovorax sp.]
MAHRSTDTQTFSSFVALNRPDRTHEPAKRGLPSVAKFVLAGIAVVVTVCLFIR